MDPFKKAYTKVVLQPLADYLIKRNVEKLQGAPEFLKNAAAGGSGYVLRDQFQFGQNYLPVGNLKTKPGASVDFDTLRRFSVQYDVARAAINRRKRQLNTLEWDIVSEDPDVKIDESLARQIKQTVKHLGGYRVRYREMMDLMVEDLLVIDALAIYKRPNVGGGLHSLQVVDGATIRLRVDETGGTPEPPEVAYKQVIRGEVVAEFTADEMYYEMMNPRTHTPYGLGPLESFVLQISSALKSEVYNMHMLTEGNIPEGLYSMPETWSSDQIKQFQVIWDAALAGNSVATSKIRFVPPGKYERTTKPEDMRYQELQQWLMKKCCMLFEIPPQELGFTETVNKSTGEVQQDIGKQAGLVPLAKFFQEIFTDVVQIDMGYPQFKFKFLGLDDVNERAVAETNAILIKSGQRTPNEARKKDGLDPDPSPLANKLMIVGGSPTFLDSEDELKAKAEAAAAIAEAGNANAQNGNGADGKETQPANSPDDTSNSATKKSASAEANHIVLVDEMRAFRKYAVNRIKAGKPLRKFESSVLPAATVTELNSRLAKAASADDARQIFSEYMQDYQVEFLANVAELRGSLSKVM